MTFDLHTHTVCSDGTTTPTENAVLAQANGLHGLAITDHDTTDGWAEAAEACAARGLELVPGIELSTEAGGRSVHLLAYWTDPDHQELSDELRRLREERERRTRTMLDRLRALGVDVAEQRVRAIAGDAPLGRPHVAAALVQVGAVPDVQTAFDRYLHDGGPAYEPKRALTPERGVELIRAAGGVAVVAHPGMLGDTGHGLSESLFADLVAAGLAGVEADHPGHDPQTALWWRRAAERHDLVVTGASDFHGERKDVNIGARSTPAPVLAELRSRAANATGRTQSWS